MQEYWYVGTAGCYGTMHRVTSPRVPTDSGPTGRRGPLETFGSWPGAARWGTYAAVGLVLVLLLTLLAATVVVRRPLPQTDGSISVPGLAAEVDVLRDAQGVAQVYADDSSDLFFAQGYVQAQDRFWQMDVRRHITAGRLSELVGEGALEADLAVRTIGWREVAEREIDLLSSDSRSYLESYADGVNAWLEDRGTTELGVEYSVLALGGSDYQPEAWTPADSVSWLKAMAWDLRGDMDDEIARTRLAAQRTSAQVDVLYPRFPYDVNEPILPAEDGAGAAGRPAPGPAYDVEQGHLDALELAGAALEAVPELVGSGDAVGSNSWVVSGEHTDTGMPMLANDPHLAVSQPGVWTQVGLHCRTLSDSCPFDVSGFGFAGLPGVVIGHNQDIAWGMTNLDPDVSDLFLEQVEGDTYLYGRRRLPVSERQETIRVRGGPDRRITVRSTRHGPILSDVSAELLNVGANAQVEPGAPERDGAYAVALSWTALTPRPTADAIFELNRATGWEDFREAARSFAVPSQNLVYADREGNIGYQAPGDVPIRRAGRDGRYPAAGWDPRQDWTGNLVPFEQLPSRLNPEEGFVVAANQAVTEPGYPFLLSAEFDQGYRSQRIRTLLTEQIAAGSPLDLDDMASIQADTRNAAAPMLTPYLLRLLLPSEYYADGQRLLADWDLDQPADSPAAAYFNAVWSQLLELTFHDDLPEELWPDGGARWVAVVENLLRQPQSSWWDDADTAGVIEDRDDVLTGAMREARDELTRTMSVSPRQWAWGELHQLELEHETVGQSEVGLVRALLNRGPFAVGGGGTSVDATAWDAAEGYTVTSAPSMRMLVDLADLDRSRWVNLGGQSGHPASPHYRDQVETWVAGGSYPWAFTEDAVRRATTQRLVLQPPA